MKNIRILNRSQSRFPITAADIHSLIKRTRQLLGKTVPVTIVGVGPRESRQLNTQYRRKRKPANILTFVSRETGADIILCPTVIRRDANIYGRSYREQFVRILAHGLLHASGKHHRTPSEETEVERLTNAIVQLTNGSSGASSLLIRK